MDISGSELIPADRQAVWAALNDPEVLKICIPGCESLEKTSDTEMTAAVTSKIGPVKAKFKGEVTLENINAPESYTISGEGKGGVAGFAKGGADIRLTEASGGTLLEYTAKAQVGGKLAQLGSRLIESTARKMAEEFFSKFSSTVAGQADAAPEAPAAAGAAQGTVQSSAEAPAEKPAVREPETSPASTEKQAFGGPMVWGLVALGVLIIVLALAL